MKAIEIVEERLPFGLEALFLTQAGQFLGEGQGQERDKDMAARMVASILPYVHENSASPSKIMETTILAAFSTNPVLIRLTI